MAEEILNDSLPDLRELENKVGRKTPESLLMWMRDATDREDGWRSDVVDRSARRFSFSDHFTEKINNLKQEMKWLRSADVRILRQLVVVHEGIEAMRWLMEERDALVSRGSSLTSSLSSLATTEEPGPSMSPCRENLSPTQNMTELSGDECVHHQPHTDHDESDNRSYFDMLSSESTEVRPSSPLTTFEDIDFTQSRNDQLLSSPANCLDSTTSSKPQPWDLNVAATRNIRSSGDTIRRALLRSSRKRKEVKADSDIFIGSKKSEEKQTEQQTELIFTDCPDKTVKEKEEEKEEEEGTPDKETMLLGYDAQWCWVESQDDITFV